MTIATKITFLRILLIFPIIFFTNIATFQANLIALALFIVAALTDYLDGYIARKTNSETNFGSLMDLLADKILVCIVLIWLIKFNNSLLFIIPVLIIVTREIVISSLRQFIVEIQSKNTMQVSLIGKSKTTIQLIATALVIISPDFGAYFYWLAILILWIASLMSLLSFYSYIQEWKKLIS